MQGKTGAERLWAGCDALLLVMVFVLLAVVWYSNSREESLLGRASERRRESAVRLSSRSPSAVRPVEEFRLAHAQRRVNSIARSMVASGWERCPLSPAMDMREDGKTCELFFTLPEGIAEESVRVTAAGGVLTLTMKDAAAGKLYLQRIRIPSGAAHAETLRSVISNDVLRVRIGPAGG